MRGLILEPTVLRQDDNADPGPDAGPLAGKTIGFRVDIMWRAWDWVSEVWAKEFAKAGAKTNFLRTNQNRVGPEGERLSREIKEFLGSIDVAVVGLGNCGSCTGWTVHDAISAAKAGIPTCAVVTQNFEQLGRSLAERAGRSGLRFHVLPYPLNEQRQEDVEVIGREHFSKVLKTLGAQFKQKQKVMT
jgi:hypothetical protein